MTFVIIILSAAVILISLVSAGIIGKKNRDIRELDLRLEAIQREKDRILNQNTDMEERLLISQMKPHFFYNTLNAIYYLCKRDPLAAQNAINSFSEYMRENLESLENSDPIGIEKELEIVRHYLDLERLRLNDELIVEYDIQAKDFKVPPLSVETLAENAVKHGIGKSESGGRLLISTKREKDSYIICVKDDGAGFDENDLAENERDERSHIGLSNLKKRLESACLGRLEIESKKGKGTLAVIRIPALNQGPLPDDTGDKE